MKLFKLVSGLGMAVFAAEDAMQVLCLISKHNALNYMYERVSAKDILKDLKEVPGYDVSGQPSVIALYIE